MKVLIIVHSPTWFTELSVLGRYIHSVPEHEVQFHIINYSHWTMDEFAASLRGEGIACSLESEDGPPRQSGEGAAEAQARSGGWRDWLVEKGTPWLREKGPPEGRDFLVHFHELNDAIADARALAAKHKPDVVVIGGNNPGYTTPALIKGFKQLGIPTVIVSSTMSNGLEEAAVYSGDERYHVKSDVARRTAAVFRKWVLDYNGLRLLRCPAGRVLALEALRIAPPQPWAFNSGHAEAIAMESAAMVDYYAKAGLPRGKMVLTGTPSDDSMAKVFADAAALRQALYGELELPPDKPMLLTALVPDFLYVNGGRPQCDFQRYDDLVNFWIETLADQGTFNVVVALHPSVKRETMLHIERPNVRIASRRTADLVPLCDLYVASISSTIRWAIACGKPVINYDVYRYRYTDFLRVAGLLATEEKAEFADLVRRMATDRDLLAQTAARQQSEAGRWGQLDGRSCRRIVDLLAK